jgi:hypothetical protein
MNGRIEKTDGEASEPPSSGKIRRQKLWELQVQMELADRLPLQAKRLHAADAPGRYGTIIVALCQSVQRSCLLTAGMCCIERLMILDGDYWHVLNAHEKGDGGR